MTRAARSIKFEVVKFGDTEFIIEMVRREEVNGPVKRIFWDVVHIRTGVLIGSVEQEGQNHRWISSTGESFYTRLNAARWSVAQWHMEKVGRKSG